MKHKLTSLVCVAFASLLAMPSASAQLTPLIEQNTSYFTTYPGNIRSQSSRGPDGPRFFSTLSLDGRCAGYANFGVLRVFGDISWPGRNGFDHYWANSFARFRDVMTINHPTRNGDGRTYRMTFSYRIDAVLTSTGGVRNELNFAEIRSSAVVGINTLGENSFWKKWPDGLVEFGESGNVYNQTRTITALFRFGEPFYADLSIRSSANGAGNPPSYNKVDSEHTASWQGINAITDENNNPITGYTVTSASGTDYTQPVSSALQAIGAVSRKTHGTAGVFDVPLPNIESRAGGANGDHTLVFTFNNPITSGSASVSSGAGSVVGSPTFSGNTMVVNLTGVTNAQSVTVNLTNMTDSFGQTLASTSRTIGFLAGDTNGDAVVNGGDAIQTRSRSGQDTGAANFRSDVNADGVVNSGDTIAVRSRSGTGL
jgi:hypothetical protein